MSDLCFSLETDLNRRPANYKSFWLRHCCALSHYFACIRTLGRSPTLQHCKNFPDTWAGRLCRPPSESDPPPRSKPTQAVMQALEAELLRPKDITFSKAVLVT